MNAKRYYRRSQLDGFDKALTFSIRINVKFLKKNQHYKKPTNISREQVALNKNPDNAANIFVHTTAMAMMKSRYIFGSIFT